MARRTVTHRRLQKYSVGDMRERITIHVRTLTEPDFGSSSFSESYDAGIDMWASVATPSLSGGKVPVFNGVALPSTTTHVFIIRFDASITSENVINWENEYYSVLGVIDPDRRQQYIVMAARLLGDDTKAANK